MQGIKCTFEIKSPETPLFTKVSGDYAQMGKSVQCRSGMPIPIDFAGGDVSFLHLIIFYLIFSIMNVYGATAPESHLGLSIFHNSDVLNLHIFF